jgi:DNA helicase-2/ATP-dependent DNA helicase PcrA
MLKLQLPPNLFMDFLQGLNPQQLDAAAHVDGPLLILAGAGSGKTRVITHRIAHLICHHGVPAYSVLAVTFTNKAAEEMRNRIGNLLAKGGASGTPVVSTFHSFCVRLLRRDGARLADVRPGFTTRFTVYDDDEQLSIIKSIFRALGLDEKFMQYRAVLSRISHAKNHKQTAQDFYKDASDPKMSRLAVIFEKYDERLRQANALDFDDLLLESVRLLQHDAETRMMVNRRISYLMIDEYQDTNRTQYELMRLLTTEHANVCVVGDEDQSIYGWRGADIRNILDFEKDYPRAKVIRLEQNYRSTQNILKGASALVANNKERKGKNLWTDSGEGARIKQYDALDGENEALFIADTIDKLLLEDPKEKIAVLYRTNSQSRQIEEALRRYRRKYIVVGGFSFYQRAEVKDILGYLKSVSSPHDSINLLRIINTPARGIGKTTIEQIEQFGLENNLSIRSAIVRMLDEKVFPGRAEAALSAFLRMMDELVEQSENRGVDQTLRLILDRTGYKKMLEDEGTPEAQTRLENINELLNAAAEAAERGENIAEFLDHAALASDSDNLDAGAQVSLLTMHNAKGLEFPIVFIAGMEEGLFPHSRSLNSEPQMEEERRLCYVGMTRAEKRLYLSWAKYRRKWGGGQPEACIQSRFLSEVPKALLEKVREESGVPQVNLFAERSFVRETARKNLYTGKTFNSVENISQFFAERQGSANQSAPSHNVAAKPAAQQGVQQAARPVAPPKKKPFGSGSTVTHSKYGRGTVLRIEGQGDDAKLTVSFPGHGLKKLVAKFAGIKIDE